MVTRIMRKMHNRPSPGECITVFFGDDRALDCVATLIHSTDFSGIMIYHDGKAIDEELAVGWMPAHDLPADSERETT